MPSFVRHSNANHTILILAAVDEFEESGRAFLSLAELAEAMSARTTTATAAASAAAAVVAAAAAAADAPATTILALAGHIGGEESAEVEPLPMSQAQMLQLSDEMLGFLSTNKCTLFLSDEAFAANVAANAEAERRRRASADTNTADKGARAPTPPPPPQPSDDDMHQFIRTALVGAEREYTTSHLKLLNLL